MRFLHLTTLSTSKDIFVTPKVALGAVRLKKNQKNSGVLAKETVPTLSYWCRCEIVSGHAKS